MHVHGVAQSALETAEVVDAALITFHTHRHGNSLSPCALLDARFKEGHRRHSEVRDIVVALQDYLLLGGCVGRPESTAFTNTHACMVCAQRGLILECRQQSHIELCIWAGVHEHCACAHVCKPGRRSSYVLTLLSMLPGCVAPPWAFSCRQSRLSGHRAASR